MAGGDTDALGLFYERWFVMMYGEARRLTRRDESFCLDVVQDAMLRIARRMRPMKSDAQLAGWLRTVIRSCACDRLRSEQARLRREQSRQSTSAHAAGDQPDADRLRWLHGEIERLDESLRRPLLLRIVSGWTLAQIGTALGLSPGAVDGRVNRALTRLRRSAPVTTEADDD